MQGTTARTRTRSSRPFVHWPSVFSLSMAFFFFQAEDGIRDRNVTGVQTCALPILGKTALAMFPESLGTHGFKALKRAAATRAAVEFEDFHPVMGKWFSHKAYPTPDGGMAVYFEDISARSEERRVGKECRCECGMGR